MNERNDSSLLLLFLAVQREVDVKNTQHMTSLDILLICVGETGGIERKRGK